jgi:hypothetical protein
VSPLEFAVRQLAPEREIESFFPLGGTAVLNAANFEVVVSATLSARAAEIALRILANYTEAVAH